MKKNNTLKKIKEKPSKKEELEFYILSGDKNYIYENYSLALTQYKKAEEISPEASEYKFRIGKTLLKLEKPGEALNYFLLSLKNSRENARIHNALSYTYHSLKKLGKALKHCKKSVELDFYNPIYRHNLGTIKMEILKGKPGFRLQNLYKIALDYEQAGLKYIDRHKCSKNFSSLGLLFFTKGEFEAAKNWYKRSLRLDSENGEIHINMGVMDLLDRKYGEAIKKFNKAIEYKGNIISALRGKALSYENMGNINKAITNYEKLLELKSEDKYSKTALNTIYNSLKKNNMHNSFLNLSRIYSEEGKIDKACYELNNAIKMGVKSFELVSEINRLALSLTIKKKEDDALRLYEKCASILKEIYGELKIKYLRKDEFFEIETVYPLSEADRERIICYRMLRDLYRQKNLITTSEYWHSELYNVIRETASNVIFYNYRDVKKLIYEIEKSIDNSPLPCPTSYKVLGDLYLYEGNLKKALSNYKKAKELKPEKISYIICLAKCYFKIQMYKEATKEYGQAINCNCNVLLKFRKDLNYLLKILNTEDLKFLEKACYENLNKNSQDHACYFILGKIYLKLRKDKFAIKALEHALSLNIKNKLYLNSLAKIYIEKGIKLYRENKTGDAINLLNFAHKLSIDIKTKITSSILLGTIHYEKKNFNEALNIFSEMEKIKTEKKLKVYKFMGLIYENTGEEEKAVHYNKKFLEELNKEIDYKLLSKTFCFIDETPKDYIDKIPEYERAIELEPENSNYYIILANLYKNIDKLEELSNKFLKKIKENPLYGQIFLQTGRILYEEKKLDEAEMEYEKALKVGLKHEELAVNLNKLAIKFYEKNKIKKAITILNKAIDFYPEYTDPYYHIGNIYYHMGEENKSIEYLSGAIEKEVNSEKKANYLNTLGNIYLKQGKMKVAFEQFNEAIKIAPCSEESYLNMAIADYKSGIMDKAIEKFLKVLELKPEHFRAIKYLRDLHKGNKEEKQWQEQLINLLKEKVIDWSYINKIKEPEELEELLIEYEKAFGIKKEDTKYLKKLGEFYINQGNLNKASEIIGKCTNLEPDLAYLHIKLSNAYLKIQDFEKARTEACKALDKGIKTVDLASVCIKIGNKFLERGELEKARNEYEKAWNMGNKTKDLALKINKLGVEYSSINETDIAIELFEKATDLIPENIIFHKNLGTMYQRKDLIKKAVHSFETAKNIKPDDIKILEKLKNIYQENGYFRKAIKILEQLIEFKPHNAIYNYFTGKIYYDSGKFEKAIKYYENTIKLKKDWHSPHVELGYIYMEKNDYKKSKEEFEHALNMNNKSPKALVGLGRIYNYSNDISASERYYSEALDIYLEESQKKDISSEILVNFGDLYLYKIEIDKAIEIYQKATKIKDNNKKAFLHLGKALFIKGELPESKEEFEKLARDQAEFPEIYYYLGDIYRIKTLLQESIDYYRTVIRLNPDWTYKAYQSLGEIYEELKEKKLSLQCYKKAQDLKKGSLNDVPVPLFPSLDIKKIIESMEKDLKSE